MTLSQVTFASELTRQLCSLSVAGRAPVGPGLTHEVRVSLSASHGAVPDTGVGSARWLGLVVCHWQVGHWPGQGAAAP
jgi:hypothetical protein